MNRLTRTSLITASAAIAFAALIIPAAASAATASMTTSVLTANATVGTADQTAATSTSVANVPQVKATRTLTVGVAPVTTNTMTVGLCVVTFATTTSGAPGQDLNCSDNAARINTATTTNDVAKTTTQIANEILALTGISDTGHGAITVAASSTSATSAVFTTTGTETSATAITFTDGTSGKITTATTTTGVIPVAQVGLVTIGGTVDTGDVFTAHLPGFIDASYTVQSTDTTTANIATGLSAAILASSGYSSQLFTSAPSTNTVVLTAKTAGTAFTIATTTAANRAAAAMSVSFTPVNPSSSATFGLTINGTGANARALSSVADVTAALANNLTVSGLTGATCSGGSAVTCTATTPGTPFSYEASASTDSGRSSGGGGGSSHSSAPATTPAHATPATTPTSAPTTTHTVTGASAIKTTLHLGSNGASVSLLQKLLAQDPSVYASGTVSGHFGPMTLAAVQAFQVKYGIAKQGDAGYGAVGPKTRAQLVVVFGA